MPTPDSPKTLPVWAVGRLKFAGAKAGTLPKQRRDDLDSFPTKVIFLLLSGKILSKSSRPGFVGPRLVQAHWIG